MRRNSNHSHCHIISISPKANIQHIIINKKKTELTKNINLRTKFHKYNNQLTGQESKKKKKFDEHKSNNLDINFSNKHQTILQIIKRRPQRTTTNK